MKIRFKYFSIALVALTFPASVWATNGYFTHGVSTAEKGLAGAGVAFSQDTLAAGNNPAGMVWQGKRYDVGGALFAPMRNYDVSGSPSGAPGSFGLSPGKEDSDNESFLIPQYGQNWMLDDESSIGVSVFGNGGMNTEYGGSNTFFDGTAGVDLSQLFIATTYSAKLSDKSSWGISGIVAYQRFEAKGLANFGPFSTDPDNLTNNSHDSATGFGVRIGFQTEISPGVRLGGAYQPEIDMDEFDDYSGLFAEQGDFDIPSTYTIGLAVDIGSNGILVVDLQQINYEDVAAVSNKFENLTDECFFGDVDSCLGGDDGAGFGWEDMTILKVGYQWQDGDMTWRVGFSTGDQPIPDDEVLFNILAPGVMEEHVTFGFTRQLDDKSSINFAAMYAPSNSIEGTNPLDPVQEIELEMDQYELAFSYNRRL
jgi:long-chain fatty acid transport protein